MYKEQFHFLGQNFAKAFVLLSMVFFMQGCGSSDDSFADSLTDFEAEQADNLPFAFDVNIDHIGYMSCESDSLSISSKHFNFKAGSFNSNSGVKFRDNFFSSIGDLGGNREKLAEYLAASKRNVNAGVVMSIRTSGDFRPPFSIVTEEDADATDLVDFVSPMLLDPSLNLSLSDPNFSSLMFDNREGINYISGLPGTSNKTLDSTLSFNKIGSQTIVTTALQNESYLAFTFATNDLEEPGVLARSPFDEAGLADGARTSVFGKGYKMTFAQDDISRPSSPTAVMTSVQGFNLENNGTSNGETWVCPTNERYIIVRAQDARRRFDSADATRGGGVANNPWDAAYEDGGTGRGGYYMEYLEPDIDNPGTTNKVKHKVLCPTVPDNIAGTEHLDPAWTRVRNLLSVKDWYVFRGARYNCIVPKNTDNACYGDFLSSPSSGGVNDNANREVRYFASEDSIDKKIRDNKVSVDTGSARTIYDPITDCEAATGNGGSKFCPKVFSICHKQ